MVSIIKAFFSVLLSLLSVFNLSGLGGKAEDNSYKVKNEQDVLLTFAAISDIHMTDEYLRRVILECGLDDMDNAVNKPDALVLTGDMTDDGIEAQYENLKKAFEGYAPANHILPAVGNHDTWTDDNDRYEPAKENFIKYSKEIAGRELEECYYSTQINGYTFIVMASEATNVAAYFSRTQLDWLRSEMDRASQTGLPVFVISHWPLANSHGLPETWGEDEDTDPLKGSMGAQSDAVEAILKEYENVFLISGHVHNGLVNDDKSDFYGYASVESDGSFHSINLPSFMYMTAQGYFMNGCGYSVEVYENEVVFRARNFITGTWQPDYDVTIAIK